MGDDDDTKRSLLGDEENTEEQEEEEQEEEGEGEEDEEEEEDEVILFTNDNGEEEEWTENHMKIIYLISLFGEVAATEDDKETWLRQMPMFVLLFEGVVAGVLDFDYAPASILVSSGESSYRLWVNISQEGKSAVDDLREKGHVNAIKLLSVDFQPCTAFQLSASGLKLLKLCPEEYQDQLLDLFCVPGKKKEGKLMAIRFADNERFEFYDPDDPDNTIKESAITETEDVSYVSSPFLPECIRAKNSQRKPLSSNKHRAHECAQGETGIQDELSEAIVLQEVKAMVGEWIPFGSNQIVALNERLGALDRCQGGLFTAMVDKKPTDTQFNVPPGLTQVTILDYDFVRFINFEAEIHYPEADGIIQIENFGMHLSVDGSIIYGVIIEAILDNQSDHISLDHLSRLLVDVHQDSTQIMDDLLSQYQKNLLNTMFQGDASMRNKYNLILCEAMEPALPADSYMNKEDEENELKQVLGDIRAAFDVTKSDVIIIGKDGLLVCGKNIVHFERLLIAYLAMLCREIFIKNFFVRLFVLDDLLSRTRKLIVTFYEDPNHITRIRKMLNQASQDTILLEEILAYLRESLDEIILPPMPTDAIGKRMQKMLDCHSMKEDILMRCDDLQKLIDGSRNELTTLTAMSDTITTRKLEDVFQSVNSNTKFLVDASAAQERASASLAVMQIILSGSFAFDILDRISGGSLNVELADWFMETWVAYTLYFPFWLWVLNLIWLGIVCGGIRKFMKYLEYLLQGMLTLKMKIDRPIHISKLNDFLAKQKMRAYDINIEENNKMRKAVWEERSRALWGGARPKISILYDEENDFLWEVFFTVDTKRSNYTEKDLLETLINIFEEHGIWRKEDEESEDMMEGILEEEKPQEEEEEEDGDKSGGAKVVEKGGKEGEDNTERKSDGKDEDKPAKPA